MANAQKKIVRLEFEDHTDEVVAEFTEEELRVLRRFVEETDSRARDETGPRSAVGLLLFQL